MRKHSGCKLAFWSWMKSISVACLFCLPVGDALSAPLEQSSPRRTQVAPSTLIAAASGQRLVRRNTSNVSRKLNPATRGIELRAKRHPGNASGAMKRDRPAASTKSRPRLDQSVPECRDAILTRELEDALGQSFFAAAPAQRREFEPNSKRRKRRPASSPSAYGLSRTTVARSGETSRGSPQEAADHGVCFGFISAFLDAQEHGHFKAFCPTGELTVSAAIEIVADHFDRNPQHRLRTGLKAALENAFPCRS